MAQVLHLADAAPQPAQDVLAPVRERVKQMQRDRARYEPVVHSNRAFASGRQWLKYSRADRRLMLDPTDVEGGRERTTVNLLGQYLKTAEGALAGLDQRKDLLFRREDIPSEDFTKAANDGLSYGWDYEWEASRILARTKRQIVVDGTAAVRCYFDPTVGRDLGQVPLGDGQPVVRIKIDSTSGQPAQEELPTEAGKPIIDPELARAYVAQRQMSGQRAQFKTLNEGRIRWKNGSFFNLLVPPGIEDPDEFPYEAWVEAVSLERLLALYGDKAKGLQADSLAVSEMLGVREQADDTLGRSEEDMAAPGKLDSHAALVTYFERPCREYPKGRVVIYAGERLLDVQEQLPYRKPNGDWHSGIAYFRYWPLEGRFWGQGLVEPGKKIQKIYNRVCQQEQLTVERSQPYMLAHKNSKVESPREVMQVVRYDEMTQAPTAVNPPGPGAYLQAYKEALKEDLQAAMGIHGVSLGEEPARADTYAAQQLRSDQDKTKLDPILEDFQRGVDSLTAFSVFDMRRYWPSDKLLALAGEDEAAEVVEFTAQKLPEFFLLKLAESARKRSPGAEAQLVTELFNDAMTIQRPLPLTWKFDSLAAGRALPLPDEPKDAHLEKARWQNSQLQQGRPVQTAPWDDVTLHIPEHTELVLEAEMSGDDLLLQNALTHLQSDQALAAQQAEQAQQAAMEQQAQAQLATQPPDQTSQTAA